MPVPSIAATEDLNVHRTSTPDVAELPDKSNTVCHYQSVIQFAGRSQTPPPPPVPTEHSEEGLEESNTPANVNVSTSNNVDDTQKNLQKPLSNELRVELVEESNERDPKMSNISIYRQLLSPYLRPPPNLDFRNGSQEQEKHRGYHVQSDRLPIRKENVDIYRSILMSSTDQEHQSVIQNNSSASQDNVKVTNSKTESLVIHGQSSEYFSEMHWRKRTSQCFNQMEQ